jgi:hypothetical protein
MSSDKINHDSQTIEIRDDSGQCDQGAISPVQEC